MDLIPAVLIFVPVLLPVLEHIILILRILES